MRDLLVALENAEIHNERLTGQCFLDPKSQKEEAPVPQPALKLQKNCCAASRRNNPIEKTLGTGADYSARLHYVEQSQSKGIAHALGLLDERVHGPMLVALGDVYFQISNLAKSVGQFLASPEPKAELFAKIEYDHAMVERDFVIFVDTQNHVKRVIEKPKHTDCNLKGCGLYLFRPEIFDAIRRTPRSALRDEYELTDAIQILIDDDYDVLVNDHVKADVNLTYPTDFIDLNMHLLANQGQKNCIAPGTEVGIGVQLSQTVVGAGAVIGGNGSMSRCIVFENARITLTGDIFDTIIPAYGAPLVIPTTKPANSEEKDRDRNRSYTQEGVGDLGSLRLKNNKAYIVVLFVNLKTFRLDRNC